MRGAKASLSFCATIVNKSTLICKQFVNLGRPESDVEAEISIIPHPSNFVNRQIAQTFIENFPKICAI
jgi:hypothetical protein